MPFHPFRKQCPQPHNHVSRSLLHGVRLGHPEALCHASSTSELCARTRLLVCLYGVPLLPLRHLRPPLVP